jgi:hypothetical protein
MTNPDFPFPIQPKALAVPSDDGLGFHNAQGRAPIGPNSGEPDPNESVARSQSQATVLVHALQHKKLMTEGQVLSVQSGPSLKQPRRKRSREARSTHIPLHPATLSTSSTLSMRTDFLVETSANLHRERCKLSVSKIELLRFGMVARR